MKDKEFEGKNVLITGAGGGIGKTIALKFAEQGAAVIGADINRENLDQLNQLFEKNNYKGKMTLLNVSDSQQVNTRIEEIEYSVGPLDVLVNVAGILKPGLIENFTDDEWNATFSVNTTGVFNVSRAVAKSMIDRRKGSIITVGSNASCTPRTSMAAYAASKAAAAMLTKCLGLELSQYNIRCNIVSPGSTDTDMLKQLWKDENGASDSINGVLEDYRVGIPLRKLAKPSEVAEAVMFLASERSWHITMQNLTVDGGATLGV
ncbi:2,3-dihydro-2,3-dihydroxybenzoate dehydrogenase [Halobacillus salinarum]|uniref:2,3-dihydro-2,3-dihydroxybenzoate dehydrogenase n=1 Tax=Halobacillus salinarum TaxID=2932257 RepID=A0ABY4EF34_9BACI|nr:2,3-dihydro-2,3-dihydroxybenzoate dehydrogenase [Halobacillus salinarum]UOQ42590.1 2,3-dihydro-2,3-dihydroxybenzoate dehydrogenase [Halobacillus salinarum]